MYGALRWHDFYEDDRVILFWPCVESFSKVIYKDEQQKQWNTFRGHSKYGAAIAIEKPNIIRINCLAIDCQVIEFFLKQVKIDTKIYFDNVEMESEWGGTNNDIYDLKDIFLKTVTSEFEKITFTATNNKEEIIDEIR